MSGRLRLSHRIFGPTACEVSALPPCERMRSAPIACGQLLDLASGARVYAVEHGVHERRAVCVDRQHARADRACADGLHLGRVKAAIGEKLSTEPDEIAPPVLLGAMLGPTRARHDELMRASGARQHTAVCVDENALRFVGPDVDAESGVHSG